MRSAILNIEVRTRLALAVETDPWTTGRSVQTESAPSPSFSKPSVPRPSLQSTPDRPTDCACAAPAVALLGAKCRTPKGQRDAE